MAIEIISTLKPKNNGTFPIAEAKDIDVNGVRLDEKLANIGTGGGGGGGIIDVTELPTEGIDEQSIYRLANAGGAEVYAVVPDGGGYAVQEAATFLGVPTIIVVTEDPQNETLTEFTETSAFLYVQQSTGVVYLNYGGTITTLSAMIGATDGGWSTDVNNETPSNSTIYAVSQTTYSYHACKNGAWVELVDKNYADNKAAEEAAKIKGLKTMVLPVIGSLYKNIALLAGSTEFFRVKYDGSINYEYTKDGANGSGSIAGNSFDVTYTEQSGMIMVSLSSYGISSSTELLLIGDGSTLNNTGLVHTVDGVKQEVTSVDTSEMTNITLYYF